MLNFDLKKKSKHRSGRTPDSDKKSDAARLEQKTFRNIMILAAVGFALILCDLMVSWGSGSIDVISDEKTGQLYLIRPSKEESTGHLSLKAEVTSEHGDYEKNMDLTLSPYRENGHQPSEDKTIDEAQADEERIMYELRTIASDVDRDRSKKKVALPTTLSGGEKIRWSHRRQSHTLLLMILMVVSAAVLYRRRMLPLEKQRQRESRSITDCLPDFIHQIVLLMNAGLVLSSAFTRIVEEDMRMRETEERFFYITMRNIYSSIKNTNGSIIDELVGFARESGAGDLMRISTIIRDNANKGTELIEKLERESASLWHRKKIAIEERGRLAETKMTLPLSIFLGVLILITVSPALLEL